MERLGGGDGGGGGHVHGPGMDLDQLQKINIPIINRKKGKSSAWCGKDLKKAAILKMTNQCLID